MDLLGIYIIRLKILYYFVEFVGRNQLVFYGTPVSLDEVLEQRKLSHRDVSYGNHPRRSQSECRCRTLIQKIFAERLILMGCFSLHLGEMLALKEDIQMAMHSR